MEWIKYPKINTLFMRDENGKITSKFSDNNFNNIKYWQVEEKIDGTNIRIMFDGENIKIGGRTDAADIPKPLLKYLKEIFTIDKLKEIFPNFTENKLILFGEGYGSKIQSGSYYSDEQRFVLFDILIGKLWLRRDNIREISHRLSIPFPPPICSSCAYYDGKWLDALPFDSLMTTNSIIDLVRSKPDSRFSKQKHIMEGIIARTDLLDRRGNRVMFKLKCRDFD